MTRVDSKIGLLYEKIMAHLLMQMRYYTGYSKTNTNSWDRKAALIRSAVYEYSIDVVFRTLFLYDNPLYKAMKAWEITILEVNQEALMHMAHIELTPETFEYGVDSVPSLSSVASDIVDEIDSIVKATVGLVPGIHDIPKIYEQ